MRRLVLLTACAVALFAATALAAPPFATLSVNPNKAGKGSTTTLDITPPKADKNPKSIVVRVAKGATVDPRAVAAKCTPSQANANKCPASSRVGGGTNAVTVTSSVFPPSKATVLVDLFLAPPPVSGDKAGIVAHFKVKETGQEGHVTGRITPIDTSGFGYKTGFDNLDTVIKPPQGFKAHIDHIRLTIGAHRTVTKTVNGKPKNVRYDLLTNPAKCNGSWPYDITLGYRNSSSVVQKGSGPCAK